jgi:RND superfamily putative drug exporter
VVLTLLPALLSSVGPRIDYPRIRKEGTASRGWSAWARLIVRHRVIATGPSVVLLGLLIAPCSASRSGRAPAWSPSRKRPTVRGAADAD